MKRLIATALAAAVALTAATATPVAAMDRGERNRLLLGLTALAIIGATASQSQNRSGGSVGRAPDPWYGNRDDDWRHDRRDDRDWRHGRHDRLSLPSDCQFSVRTRDGVRSVMGKSCLDQFGYRTSRLPDNCEFDIRTSRGEREVFSSSCLRRQGYRIEARR